MRTFFIVGIYTFETILSPKHESISDLVTLHAVVITTCNFRLTSAFFYGGGRGACAEGQLIGEDQPASIQRGPDLIVVKVSCDGGLAHNGLTTIILVLGLFYYSVFVVSVACV